MAGLCPERARPLLTELVLANLLAEHADGLVEEGVVNRLGVEAVAVGPVPLASLRRGRAFGTGTGSELRRPLGITIIGGLIVSQMLTLFTTPVVYLYFDRLQHFWSRVRARRRARRSAPLGQEA